MSGFRSTDVHYSPRRHAVRSAKHGKARYALSLLAVGVSFGLVALTLSTPPVVAQPDAAGIAPTHGQTTELTADQLTAAINRDGFSVTKIAPKAVASTGVSGAPRAAAPDPGTAQAIAHQMLQDRGMGDDQFDCLVALWNRESHWNTHAGNPVSGAYGIPQALPGSKMASAGPDWMDDAATQITWGLGYVDGRYGDPCGAWSHSQSYGWY